MGELVLGRKLGWKGMVWGLFFGTLPDLDVLVYPYLDRVAQLYWHRGISHSILLMVLASLLFAKPLSWLHRKRGVTAKEAGWFVFLAWSTHVLIDVFTTYGTQVFEPFSDQRVAFNNLFIIDLFFTLPLLFCVFYWPWKGVRHLIARRRWSRAGADPDEVPEFPVFSRRRASSALALSCLYVLFSFVMKMWAVDQIKGQVAEEIPNAKVIAVAPTPFNTLLWRGLIETEDAYFVTYWSPFDKKPGAFEYLLKSHELAKPFEGQALFEGLKWFARDHWIARAGPEGKVVFIDVRFGEVRDLENRQLLPFFQWRLSYNDEGKMEANSYRPRNFRMKDALGLILERIGGHQERWESMEGF